MSTDRWMEKHILVCPYNGVYNWQEKGKNIGESQSHYTEWKKPCKLDFIMPTGIKFCEKQTSLAWYLATDTNLSVAAWGWGWLSKNRYEELLGAIGDISYLHCDDVALGVYICQNSKLHTLCLLVYFNFTSLRFKKSLRKDHNSLSFHSANIN